MCGQNFPPHVSASLFLFILSHNPIFLSPQDPSLFHLNLLLCVALFLFVFLFFFTFDQAFEVEKQKACDKIEWLEEEVIKLEGQVREAENFDIALITGSGRGRP
jgi:hypothetical protein